MSTTDRHWSRRHKLAAGALLVLLPAAIGLPASAAADRHFAPPVPVLEWADCGDGFECATARVPLDYDRPRGRSIELALIRRPAADQAHRIGSLFVNPGGPGGSGVDFLRNDAPAPAFQALAAFDVVSFDPRGVGASEPSVDCGSDQSPGPVEFFRPQTVDPAALVADADERARKCLGGSGDLLEHMSTANVARDLDLLRRAVGDTQLNYLGVSYGTAIGAMYATLFPGRARAMVLDSAVDVESYVERPFEFYREQLSSFENELDRFFMKCAAVQPACGFGGDDPEAAFDALVGRLDRQPLPSTDPQRPFPLNGDEVRLRAISTMYQISFWPTFAAALAAADAGDPAPMIAYGADNTTGLLGDVALAVDGVDQNWPRATDPYLAAGQHAYRLFDHFWLGTGYEDLVTGRWPVEDRDAFRGDVSNPADAAPILVIGGTYDPATPYIWSEELAADLGNARLLTFQSDGHGALRSLDPCLWGITLDYLYTGAIPDEGATCVDARDPFAS